MEVSKQLYHRILQHFPYTPNQSQELCTRALSEFTADRESGIFVMKGYAGTGKTSLISSLVKALGEYSQSFVLLAPTGRAARVLSFYADSQAFTIHKKIYHVRSTAQGQLKLFLQANRHKNCLFIVDEASMIPGSDPLFQGRLNDERNLLEDLIQFVFSGKGCKLILIGDTAQLPPVGTPLSPALDVNFLESVFGLPVSTFEIREVVRQARESGILYNATLLRNMLDKDSMSFPRFKLHGFDDCDRLSHEDALDIFNQAFGSSRMQDALVVCRSNKRANLYNRHIRQRILMREDEINSGDLLMVVRNNYFWVDASSQAGFIANGDLLEIKRIGKIEERYGFRFADISASMIDYPNQPDLEVKVLLDTLWTETASLGPSDYKRLYEAIANEVYLDTGKKAGLRSIREHPYYNALQVKFAYALTCHKSQGGQWGTVFIDAGMSSAEVPERGEIRWLYTAMTRATERLFLMHFPDAYFSNGETKA